MTNKKEIKDKNKIASKIVSNKVKRGTAKSKTKGVIKRAVVKNNWYTRNIDAEVREVAKIAEKVSKVQASSNPKDYIPAALELAHKRGHQMDENSFRTVWWIRNGLSADCRLCGLAMEIRLGDWLTGDNPITGGASQADLCQKKPYKSRL